MLKLPRCPYCGAVFYYKTVKRTTQQGTMKCEHCGNTFRIEYKRPYAMFLFLATLVVLAIDVLLLSLLQANTIYSVTLFTLVAVIVCYFLLPYTVQYQKIHPRGISSETLNQQKKKNKK